MSAEHPNLSASQPISAMPQQWWRNRFGAAGSVAAAIPTREQKERWAKVANRLVRAGVGRGDFFRELRRMGAPDGAIRDSWRLCRWGTPAQSHTDRCKELARAYFDRLNRELARG